MMKIDEMIKILQAFKEGEEIEWCDKDKNNWKPYQKCALSPEMCFDFMHYDFRIKPESMTKVIPYETLIEFNEAIRTHGPLFYESDNGIIVKNKAYNVYQTDLERIYAGGRIIPWAEFAEKYRWADGTACGKVVNNYE